MAKVSFTNLKMKTNTNVKTISIRPGVDIEILQYLPIYDKNDLVNVTLQNAEEGNGYNPILIDMYFDLYIVYMYTNLNFTDKQKEDEGKLYDILKSNGIIEAIKNNLDENELMELIKYLTETMEMKLKYKATIASVLNRFIDDLPTNAEEAGKIINNFNPEMFQNVLGFYKAINGSADAQ